MRKSLVELLDKVNAFHDLNVGSCDFEEKTFHLIIIEDHSKLGSRSIFKAAYL